MLCGRVLQGTGFVEEGVCSIVSGVVGIGRYMVGRESLIPNASDLSLSRTVRRGWQRFYLHLAGPRLAI